MPRGIYDRKSKASKLDSITNVVPFESDDQIDARIAERFEVLDIMTNAIINGDSRAMVVSGPAGLGKSFTVEKALENYDPEANAYTIIKGYARATGLLKLLWRFRHSNSVIVFDDADSIFFDDTSLNMIKAVCDTTERRVVSYLSEAKIIDDETAELIPHQFQFNGSIIFITNYDFDDMIERGHKLSPHFQALLSRAHYIDLTMKTRRDYMIRIRQVVKQGLLEGSGLNWAQQAQVIGFVEQHQEKLRELSLRIVIKIASIMKSTPNDWQKIAKITCCRS
jgi:hypothetical protein